MPDYGIKISLPGYDVKNATPEQCALHSDYASPKIEQNSSVATVNNSIGTGTFSNSGWNFNTLDFTFTSDPGFGTYTLVSIPYAKSYTPSGIVFVKDFQFSPNIFYQLPLSFVTSGFQSLYYRVTSSGITIYYDKTFDPFTTYVNVNTFRFIFKYYVFVENGA